VSYWMPFNGNIGLHDATWRSKFGGNIYVKNGSHGCINLPKNKAAELFAKIQKGCPVVVHP
jgi:erfK/ybiS/ycfS/ynhG family protein